MRISLKIFTEMNTVIGTYWKTLPRAKHFAEKEVKKWGGKMDFYVVKMKKGYLVVSESQIRACRLI